MVHAARPHYANRQNWKKGVFFFLSMNWKKGVDFVGFWWLKGQSTCERDHRKKHIYVGTHKDKSLKKDDEVDIRQVLNRNFRITQLCPHNKGHLFKSKSSTCHMWDRGLGLFRCFVFIFVSTLQVHKRSTCSGIFIFLLVKSWID